MLIYINRLYKCFCLSSPISNKGYRNGKSGRTAIEDQLRRRGYKLTKQREAIIKVLDSLEENLANSSAYF